jgi:hypothetical protein
MGVTGIVLSAVPGLASAHFLSATDYGAGGISAGTVFPETALTFKEIV